MKIQEAEALAGISKKSIRFYEEQGLLTPRRNSENGYREYGLRRWSACAGSSSCASWGFPWRRSDGILAAGQSLQEGMRRHLALLEEEKKNLEISLGFADTFGDRRSRFGRHEARRPCSG